MKSLFSRFRSHTPSTSRPSSTHSAQDKENLNHATQNSTANNQTKRPKSVDPSPSHTPLRSSTPVVAHHQSSSSSDESTRPRSTADPDGHDVVQIWQDGMARTVSAEAHLGAGKKVTFKSPVPTPTASVVLDHVTVVSEPRGRDVERASSMKRVASVSPVKKPNSPNKKPIPRPPTVQSSRPGSRQSMLPPASTSRPFASRKTSLPPLKTEHHPQQPSTSSSSPAKSSILTPTPSESSASAKSYLVPLASWSEMAEDDLIANLGPRERTRQEVLWEIVSSEERYVQELVKLNATFSQALLPPSATSPTLSLADPFIAQTLSPASLASPSPSSIETFDYLPIAAKYASTNGRYPAESTHPPPSAAARMNAYNLLTHGRPSEPSAPGEPSKKSSQASLNPNQRSHHSLP
ncbi:hypothetical protein P7C73_g6559, partial [Tremellales sp. Uapishka_1]